MRSRKTTPILALAFAAVLTLVLSSCSDDGSDDSSDKTTTPASSLTGGQICSSLEASAISKALGVEVGDGTPVAGGGAPSCTYSSAASGSATPSAIVVTAPRSEEDLKGATGSKAFDYFVGVAESYAEATSAEKVTVEAGDQAVRFSGPTSNVGVVQVGDSIYTVTVPKDAADPAKVDALLVAMGSAFG